MCGNATEPSFEADARSCKQVCPLTHTRIPLISAKIKTSTFLCSVLFLHDVLFRRDSNKSVKKTVLWTVFSEDHKAKSNQALVIWTARAKWTKCQQDRSNPKSMYFYTTKLLWGLQERISPSRFSRSRDKHGYAVCGNATEPSFEADAHSCKQVCPLTHARIPLISAKIKTSTFLCSFLFLHDVYMLERFERER